MLADLFTFLTTADTSGLDSDRAAAIALVRSMIGRSDAAPGQTPWAMYPGTLAEGAELPALSCTLISDSIQHQISGEDIGLYHTRVQIDAWSQLMDEMRSEE